MWMFGNTVGNFLIQIFCWIISGTIGNEIHNFRTHPHQGDEKQKNTISIL
jgi:hypothetical protein